MPWEITTAPAVEPVTPQLAKLHSRVPGSAQDDLVGLWITAARELVEENSDRWLCPQTGVLHLDRFPCGVEPIALKPTVREVTSVEYIDTDGATQTLDAAIYHVDLTSTPPRIAPVPGESWPTTEAGRMASVSVTCELGFVDAASIPAVAKHAILLLVAHWYEHPEAVGEVGAEIELGYGRLLNLLRWRGHVAPQT